MSALNIMDNHGSSHGRNLLLLIYRDDLVMKVGIVGRGAIGVCLASYLSSQENVHSYFFIRDEYEAISPLYLQQINNTDIAINAPQLHLSNAALKDLDLLILPIKHYQVENTLLSLKGKLSHHTTVLLLHNGMGTKALIEKYLPDTPYLIGITTDAAYQVSANRFHQAACGKLEIGKPLQASEVDARNIATSSLKQLMKLHPNLIWREDIEFAQYQKLAINAAINPLTATKNCKNGEIKHYQHELQTIKSEIFDLYEFMNLPIDNHELSKQIDDVIDLTKNNYSSMHQDFHKNRQTEVEGILGYLLLKGEETGMKLPFIDTLYQQIISHQTPLSGIN